MKNIIGAAAFLLCVIPLAGCGDSDNPVSEDSYMQIEVGPKYYSFPTSMDTVVVETSPIHVVDRDDIPNGAEEYMVMDDLMFPGRFMNSYDDVVAHDFVIHPGDYFQVKITNCRTALHWFAKLDADYLVLARRDSIAVSSELFDMKYTFQTTGPGKGYIGFAETDTSFGGCPGACISSNSKSLIVGYTAGVVEDLYVDLEKITWEYDMVVWKYGPEKNSTLAVFLSGSTNARRLKVETYGDGVLSCCEIEIDDDSHFSRKVGIAFRYGSDEYLKTGTKIAVYGTVGPPKVIELVNPLKD
jgi:hypothetical protein